MSMPNTILLIEDDKTSRKLLRVALENHDFIILEATSIKRCFEILERHKANAILMDLNLPDGCGLDFIKDIRSKTDVPLLIVSSERDTARKIMTFESGADDFVSKPFLPDLLIARLNAHIRRYKAINESVEAHQRRQDIEYLSIHGTTWVLDRLQIQLFDDQNQSAELTSREFALLDFLVSNPNRAIRREELCAAMKEERYIPTPRALDVKIARIRKKIHDNGVQPNIIKTIRGVGYMFSASEDQPQP